ncbi:hypothetical protein MTP99_010050 [Tenebrio molitor]|nr:hypothetical protein MTP99_010050 [Tenebrio molitor]
MTPVGQRERFSTCTPGFRPRIPEATRCYFRSRILARREFLQTLATRNSCRTTRNYKSAPSLWRRIPAAPHKMLFPVVNSCRTRNYSCIRLPNVNSCKLL